MKILLIEDSKFLGIAIARALAKHGNKVEIAKDGEEGLTRIRQSSPDAVLLDMMLPKISGTDVLRLLKADAATKDLPVIVLTGLSQRNTETLTKLGAAGYIEKTDALLDDNAATLIQALNTIVLPNAAPAGV
jgi:DNA-binding response OmpR family regulator